MTNTRYNTITFHFADRSVSPKDAEWPALIKALRNEKHVKGAWFSGDARELGDGQDGNAIDWTGYEG